MQLRVLSFVLAGGKGTRLYPLTKERAKPAVPFGGQYRIVDFVLSNLVNSGIHSIYVLIQFKSQSLLQHLRDGWEFAPIMKSQYIIPVPAQMRSAGETWYSGTADAIFQNVNLIEQSDPHVVAIFGADHVYRMNIREMIEFHERKRAQATIAAIPMPRELASEFGVLETAPDGRILRFHEKNPDAPSMPGNPAMVYASMGNYIFSTGVLLDILAKDSADPASGHDMGGDIIPAMVAAGDADFYDFSNNQVPGATDRDRAYWRDVGTLDSYYEASMDLISVHPIFNLYNHQWPIYTSLPSELPPAKFVFEDPGRVGHAVDSIVSGGVIVSGGTVRRSVLSPGVIVESGALVEDSVLMNDVVIGPGAVVRRSILDKNVTVAPDAELGVEPEIDASSYTRSDKGVIVVGKGVEVPRR
jgi:glucose-1-phosphate adenylyltransferase